MFEFFATTRASNNNTQGSWGGERSQRKKNIISRIHNRLLWVISNPCAEQRKKACKFFILPKKKNIKPEDCFGRKSERSVGGKWVLFFFFSLVRRSSPLWYLKKINCSGAFFAWKNHKKKKNGGRIFFFFNHICQPTYEPIRKNIMAKKDPTAPFFFLFSKRCAHVFFCDGWRFGATLFWIWTFYKLAWTCGCGLFYIVFTQQGSFYTLLSGGLHR